MLRRTVLQVIPELQTGGAERTTVDIAAALVARGDRALVASQGGRLVAELEAVGGEHVTLPLATKSPLSLWRNVGRLSQVINKNAVDLVHARSRAPAWSALAAARRARLPFVTTYHGIYNQKTTLKAFYNSVMARGDAVIANSAYTATLVADRHPFAADRITIVHRGSDLDQFSPNSIDQGRVVALRKAWGVPEGVPVILNVARLTSWKGQKNLLDALALTRTRLDRPFFAILAGDAQGRDEYLAELKAKIEAADLADCVVLPGHCADVAAAHALADVAVVASIEPEAFGRAAVEAQAASVPIIATDLGAAPETVLTPPEVVADDRTGWRVPPGDANAMADAIVTALTLNDNDRTDLTARARRHVEQKFSLAAMCEATLAVYDRVLSARKAR